MASAWPGIDGSTHIYRHAAARRALLVLFSSFFGTRFVVFCFFVLASSCRDSPGSTNGPPCSTVRHCLTQPKQALHTNPSTRPTPLPPPASHGSMQSVPTEARRGHPGKMPRQITTHRGVTSTRPAPEHRPHSTHKPTASMRDAPPEGKHTLAAAHGAPTNATKVVPTKVRTEVSQGSAH